jgi:hypothetical protein
MKRLICFFFRHDWRVSRIEVQDSVRYCTSECHRCGRHITTVTGDTRMIWGTKG